MDNFYLIYLFLIAAFGIQQMQLWARLFQWWRHVLYPTPVLLWSLFFMGRLYIGGVPNTLYSLLLVYFTLHFFVGYLLFPRMDGLAYDSAYTYLDVYEELRQKRFWVFGVAFLAEAILLFHNWKLGMSFVPSNFIYCFLFLAAALTANKGLMLVWVWLSLGLLFL